VFWWVLPAFEPLVIARTTNLQHLAEERKVLVFGQQLIMYEGELYCRDLAKYAAAFFSISFSCLSLAISLSFSMRSSTYDPLSSLSFDSLIQVRSLHAGILSSPATDATVRPGSLVSRTAFSRNSLVYVMDFFFLVMMRSFAFLHKERTMPRTTVYRLGGTSIIAVFWSNYKKS